MRIGISSTIGRETNGCRNHAAERDTQFRRSCTRDLAMRLRMIAESELELIARINGNADISLIIQKTTTRPVVEPRLYEGHSASNDP